VILSAITTHPTYTQPTSSINNVTNTYEIGTTQSISITQTFIQNDAGVKISEIINKNNIGVSTGSTYSENLIIVPTTIYNGSVTYSAGTCKVNNIGVVDCIGRIQSGTTNSSTRTVSGIYPVYYLKSNSPITGVDMQNAINNGTANKIVVNSTGTISLPFNLSSEYMAIAYPSTSTTKTVYYVSVLDTGPISGVFPNFSVLNVNSSNGYWTNISYKIHTSNLLNNSASVIELRNN
jgi:hypothetical protein